jgi:hypothetical protein
MDPISPIMDALAMTQPATDAVSQVIEQYSNSTDVVVRQYQSYIVPLAKQDSTLSSKSSGHVFNPRPSRADLGSMSVLPIEIVQEICLRLDLRSLTRIKVVNRQMSNMVAGIPQYQNVTSQSLTILRGLLSVEIGGRITCQMLYEKLKDEACETCGGYGTHLYLLKFKRVCYMCFMFH